MLNQNNAKSNKSFFDADVARENIHKCCEQLASRAPHVLEFIFQKKGVVSQQELVENFPEITDSYMVMDNVTILWHAFDGKPYYLPYYVRYDEYVNQIMQSITRPIFMEEAQMMLQNQATQQPITPNNLQQQQIAAPSTEQNQCTVQENENYDVDDVHDSDF
ncbi:hypothetical protein Fsol_00364 [Candidatus Fokinia solitaria]|uniref:Uncharacterized protein n=1 Tax=Candidatus Fokinia solitaria TaxID=1802984 RepID=A0A2U8BS45_9RICK|nr:hypothetical protein [Candidatus Fokinia solitaria]AWD33162.1 hypothetical protein Fsol_00364 [Candidatus Fokinia solitaria]